MLNPDILPPPQHKVVCFFSCSKRNALQCVHLCDMVPNECTTNTSTSSAVWRACFPARRARAPRLAASRWSTGWAALAARMAEAFRFLTACCCSAGWVDLAAGMEEAFRFLTACCCSTGWVDLAARMEEAFCFLTACCCSAGWVDLAACMDCPGSTPGRGISFPNCLLLFSRLGCPGSTPGRGIMFPHCLLLFSPLYYTQSSGTVHS